MRLLFRDASDSNVVSVMFVQSIGYNVDEALSYSFSLFQASASLIVEPLLTDVQVLVDGKDTDAIVAKNKRTSLEAIVSPPEAQDTVSYFWYLNRELQMNWKAQQFDYDFPKTGEVKVQLVVQNSLLQRVQSPEVRVLVVERLGNVRGLADHHSVQVLQARNYTVLVGRGSNITYTWDFGDLHNPITTAVPTVNHIYWVVGTYTITVTLTTPLGDHQVITSKVFVLRSGKCDTPMVLGFYPQEIFNKREVSPATPPTNSVQSWRLLWAAKILGRLH